jgi:4-amino-4-deoxy-L-arabinose transferase-like glycosyltransferase
MQSLRATIRHLILRDSLFFGILLVVVAYLGTAGLGNNYFWDDEAFVASYARNLVSHGNAALTPRHFHTFRDGSDLNENLEPRNPALTRQITAMSFRLFGFHTWAARVPFVLIGLATLVLLWKILRVDYPDYPWLRRYAFILTALSYSFLLNIRQSLYYAPILFASAGTWLFYRLVLKEGRVKHGIGLTVFLLLLFNTHYLLGGCLIMSLGIMHLLMRFRTPRQSLPRMLLYSVGAFALVTLPQLLLTRPWIRPDIRTPDSGLSTRLVLLFWNIRDLDRINYMPLPLLVLFAILFWRYRRKQFSPSITFAYLGVFFCYVVVLSFASPQPAPWGRLNTGLADVRYLLPLLPFASVVIAHGLHLLHRGMGGLAGVTLLGVLLSTNILSLRLGASRVRLLLPAFIYEVHNDYLTPYEAVVGYLQENSRQDEILVTAPAYAHEVMRFYLGDKLYIGGVLTDTTRLPREKLAEIKLPIFKDSYFPDWLISFGLSKWNKEVFDHFSRGEYEYRPVKVMGIHAKDMTRPELPWHSFRQPPQPDSPANAIHIFRRFDRNEPPPADATSAGPVPADQ